MDKAQVLRQYFGYDSFRPGQETLMDAILGGRDVLGIMPTGAGKSLCYQVPALMLPGITLVVSPLISLMKDQVQSLNQAGVHAAYINSSLTETQIAKALRLAAQGRYKIVYVAPERLLSERFLAFAGSVEISLVTVDEAHCISQWGQDFRPSYLKIVQFLRQLPVRPVVAAFTATATERVREDILCVLDLQSPQVMVTGFDRKNLYFAVEKQARKDDFVLSYIKKHPGESGIIYCATRKNVNALWELLSRRGFPATRYHAGLSAEERRENQEDFIYDRKPLIVATNAFGMGIDKSNVRFVLHYNMPQSLENYYQEAGRAGRDAEAAECILLYSPQDVMISRYLLENKERNPELDEEQWRLVCERDGARLAAMIHYCQTKDCLRACILRYFGEYAAPCGNCGNCHQEFEEADVTEQAQKILACVTELRQRYGINVIAGTLAGQARAKLRECGAVSAAAFGSLKEMGEGEIKEIIEQLVFEGVLWRTNDKYGLLRLGPGAQAVLDGTSRVVIKRVKGERPVAAGRAGRSSRRSDVLNSRGLELFEQLRNLRSSLARKEGVPPYIIFSDRTLTQMCVKLPRDREEMMQVSGVGENKWRRYGKPFIEEIEKFTGGRKEKLYYDGIAP